MEILPELRGKNGGGGIMGVYIKGLEMPEKCINCKFCVDMNEYPFHACFITDSDIPFDIDRLKNCPLVEIKTPHGGLIDRSVLLKEYQNICNGLLCRDCPFFNERNRCNIEEWILNQPPILEAEE